MANKARTVQIAREMYEYGGRLWTVTKLTKFLGVDRAIARRAVAQLIPVCGENTGRRYYYTDIAEVIADGW